jgi:hypothetical protein
MKDSQQLLPAWFVPRMMHDVWYFGLLLTDGTVLRITCINSVWQAADNSLWIDAEMEKWSSGNYPKNHMFAPTSRLSVSINVAHIMAAFEVADT